MAEDTRSRFAALSLISLGAVANLVLMVLVDKDWVPSADWVGLLFFYGIFAWPALVLAALGFAGRSVWRAGGWTRIVGLGLATLGLACCVVAFLLMRAGLQAMIGGLSALT